MKYHGNRNGADRIGTNPKNTNLNGVTFRSVEWKDLKMCWNINYAPFDFVKMCVYSAKVRRFAILTCHRTSAMNFIYSYTYEWYKEEDCLKMWFSGIIGFVLSCNYGIEVIVLLWVKVKNEIVVKMGAHGSKEKLHRTTSTKIPDRERFGSFGKRGDVFIH